MEGKAMRFVAGKLMGMGIRGENQFSRKVMRIAKY